MKTTTFKQTAWEDSWDMNQCQSTERPRQRHLRPLGCPAGNFPVEGHNLSYGNNINIPTKREEMMKSWAGIYWESTGYWKASGNRDWINRPMWSGSWDWALIEIDKLGIMLGFSPFGGKGQSSSWQRRATPRNTQWSAGSTVGRSMAITKLEEKPVVVMEPVRREVL